MPVPTKPVLVMADWEAPGAFDPRPPTTEARLRDDTLVFGRLWIPDPAGRLVPDLAAAVPQPSASGLTVRLRPNLRWSDGTPLTAADVAASCLRQCQGVVALALTPTEVRFDITDPGLLATLFVTPAAPTGTVASGPFRLVGEDTTALRFERNPYYHGRKPYLAQIVQLVPASHDAMEIAAQAGEVDYLPHLGPADLALHFGRLHTVVTRSQRLEVLVPAGLDAATVAALSAGIDRQALADQVYSGQALAAGLPVQPALASHLLAGRHPRVTLDTVCDDPARASEATLIAALWTGLGVRVTTGCEPIGRLTAAAGSPRVSLYSVLLDEQPVGAVPLLRLPAIRAVASDVHGFEPNDSAGTDLWNVAAWWLSGT